MAVLAIATAVLAVVASVGFHLGTFVLLAKSLHRWFLRPTWWVIGGLVLIAIVAHSCEITIFAGAIGILEYLNPDAIPDDHMQFSAWYRSAVAFTSMGGSAPSPSFAERWLTAVEALTGLILITWTASFLFVEMQRNPEA